MTMLVIYIMFAVPSILLLIWIFSGEENSRNDGHDSSRDDNRMYGQYRVIYSDGKRSEPMYFQVACEYAARYGGRVERI
jgi:hypothetical protein